MNLIKELARPLTKLPPSVRETIVKMLVRNQKASSIASVPMALLKSRLGAEDKEFLSILDQVVDKTIIEVGGNTGNFTRLLCAHVGPRGLVVSCEPNPLAFKMLRYRLRHQRNLIALNIGILNENVMRRLYLAGPSSTTGSVNGRGVSILCNFLTLDRLVSNLDLKKIDMLFVDAEGAELEIVAGGLATIRNHRPVLLVECHPFKSEAVVANLLSIMIQSAGYSHKIIDTSRHTVSFMFEPLSTTGLHE